MIEEIPQMEIGSKVKLTKDLKMITKIYKKGHEFTIIDQSRRGFDLQDKDGNKVLETLFIHDQLKLIVDET